MKTLSLALTALSALTGGLSAQLDFGSLSPADPNSIIARLAEAMFNDRTKLNQPGLKYAPLVPLYSEFVFEFNLDAALLPVASSGTFTTGQTAPTGGFDVSLGFQWVPNFLPAFLITGGVLEVAYFHSDAAARNTFGITRDAGLVDSLELFNYAKFVGFDKPPLTLQIPLVSGGSDTISFYALVDYAPGSPPDPRPVGPHFQDNADYWRIFQLVDPLADGVNEPMLFIMALEDQGAHPGSDFDFDDGFFLFGVSLTSPVPEPAAVAWIALAVVAATVAFRRQVKKK